MEKLKMIRGSETRAEEVKQVLESWGAKDVEQFRCTNVNSYYLVIDGRQRFIVKDDQLLKYLNYEVVELPEPEPKFQPFQKVLVRNSEEGVWECNIFSHKLEDELPFPFCCVYNVWKYCIPYEGNEHLLGTADSPKGGEK